MSTPTPQLPEYFFFQSGLSTNGNVLGLNVQDGFAKPNQPIILWTWAGGAANELWQIQGDCYIVSALSTSSQTLYLAPSNPVACYSQLIVSTTPYEWDLSQLNESGLIQTSDGTNTLAVNVNDSSPEPGTEILLYTLDGAADEVWVPFPNVLAPSQKLPVWAYVVSALSPMSPEYIPYVLSIQDGNPAAGTPVILSSQETNSQSQLWMFTSDGRILSPVGLQNLMSLGPAYGGDGGGYTVVMNPQQNPISTTQQWDMRGGPNQIRNELSMEYLVVVGGNNGPVSPFGGPAVLSAPGYSNPSYLWYLSPSSPIDAILAQAPLAFLAFTGEQEIAYQAVNKAVGVSDLRTEYTNTSVQFATYQGIINGMACPKGVSEENWEVVKTRLNTELTDVAAVAALYNNYVTFHIALFTLQNAQLGTLSADAGMEQGTNTSGVAAAVVQGALYTALEAIPVVGPVLGNLVNTAINGALAAGQISISPFSVAVSGLQDQLIATFANVLGQMSAIFTTILSDWGKLQATYQCILGTTVPQPTVEMAVNSLSLSAEEISDLITYATPGYAISVMQMLLPAQYQIYKYNATNADPVDDAPSYAQLVEYAGLVDGDQTWTKYWIASSTNWDAYPSQQALQTDLFDPFDPNTMTGAGVSPSDFFHGKNGWGFAVCWVYKYLISGCNGVVVTITNQTPNLLTVNANYSGSGKLIGPTSKILNPFQSSTFGGTEPTIFKPLSIDFEIFDPNISTQNTVGSFTVTLDDSFAEGPWPQVGNQNSAQGYALSSPILNQGQEGFGPKKDAYPAAAQIGIYLSSP
jgi:hypothetical protein